MITRIVSVVVLAVGVVLGAPMAAAASTSGVAGSYTPSGALLVWVLVGVLGLAAALLATLTLRARHREGRRDATRSA